MGLQLVRLCIAANDPERLASFWAGLLGREIAEDRSTVRPSGDLAFSIRFERADEPKVAPNRMHLHLTSASLDDQQSTVARALALGGSHLDVGQDPEDGFVVLADPEGNEFCVIEPGNSFLAGCGFVGELTCDGTQEAGYFWSRALDWPLVWDQDQETSIQSPKGGTKISWGGPPVAPKNGKNRFHLELAADGDHRAEIERLVALGATRTDGGEGDLDRVMLADPDGNEFCLLNPR